MAASLNRDARIALYAPKRKEEGEGMIWFCMFSGMFGLSHFLSLAVFRLNHFVYLVAVLGG